MRRALNPAVRTSKQKEKPTSVALPTEQNAAKHFKSVGIPPRKVSSFLHPVKDDVEARTVGVYSIPCECGEVYIGLVDL